MYSALFWLFRRPFLKIAFEHQGKPVNFDKLEQCFIDSNGLKYYRFILDDDIPILRKGKLEQHLKELEMGLNADNMEEILTYMEKALNKGDKPSIAKIGFGIEEIRNRRKMLLHPEILFDLVSTLYIREDENPAKVDAEIHSQKVVQFRTDSAGGLYDFFYNSGLTAYIPYLPQLKEGFQQFLERQQARVKAFSELTKGHSSAV